MRRNVNCYYDEEIGQWVKLPIGWELHADMVRRLVDQIQVWTRIRVDQLIVFVRCTRLFHLFGFHRDSRMSGNRLQETIPEWKDRCDILAALRTCNYDMDDCIETYFAWGQVSESIP